MSAIIISATTAMTAPLAGTPLLRAVGDRTIITSDGFSGSGNFFGRLSDAALGGSKLEWTSTASTAGPALFNISGGVANIIAEAAGSYFNNFNVPGPISNREMEISLKLITVPASQLFIDLYRNADSRKMRLMIFPNTLTGSVVYSESGAGGETVPGTSFKFQLGDTIRFSHNTKTNESKVWVNNILTSSGVYTPPTPLLGTMFGIAGTTSPTAGTIDNFILTETTI